MTEKNVHTEHCCIIHGCQYGDYDCPVWLGQQKQSYACESCSFDAIEGKFVSMPIPDLPSMSTLLKRVEKCVDHYGWDYFPGKYKPYKKVPMNRMTLHCMDKDSSACYSETFSFETEAEKEKLITEVESRVPFSRFYTEEEELS